MRHHHVSLKSETSLLMLAYLLCLNALYSISFYSTSAFYSIFLLLLLLFICYLYILFPFYVAVFQTTIKELLPPNQVILTVNATDADSDENGKVTYSLQGAGADDFYIDSDTGVIYNGREVAYSPDRATVNLAIKAADGGMCRLDWLVICHANVHWLKCVTLF